MGAIVSRKQLDPVCGDIGDRRQPGRSSRCRRTPPQEGPRVEGYFEQRTGVRGRPERMADRAGGDQTTSLDTGLILAFNLKTLSGSYWAFTMRRRVMFAPNAVAAKAPELSSACPVKFVYVVPVE